MTAFENRVVKTKLVDTLERQGYDANATDSASIAVFTDKKINNKSIKIGNYKQSYLTSFGYKSALNFINNN